MVDEIGCRRAELCSWRARGCRPLRAGVADCCRAALLLAKSGKVLDLVWEVRNCELPENGQSSGFELEPNWIECKFGQIAEEFNGEAVSAAPGNMQPHSSRSVAIHLHDLKPQQSDSSGARRFRARASRMMRNSVAIEAMTRPSAARVLIFFVLIAGT